MKRNAPTVCTYKRTKKKQILTVRRRPAAKLTCSSIDAFAQSTLLLPTTGPVLKVALQLTTLLGDELTETQTSSTPSLPTTDHPSSASPFRASLNPLKEWEKKKKRSTVVTKEDPWQEPSACILSSAPFKFKTPKPGELLAQSP